MFRLNLFQKSKEKECKICGKLDRNISSVLSVCAACIKLNPKEAFHHIREAHKKVREQYGLPAEPPKTNGGVKCNICANECVLGNGEVGFCGLKRNIGGKLRSETDANYGLLYAYKDPHVTNCCASWFCPGGTGAGYPKYAYKKGPEVGYNNYAVFFYGCNFSCLFCQNYSHKRLKEGQKVSASKFIENVMRDKSISCICYFGGSPEPHLPFALRVSREILELCEESKRILRICFEWNGAGNSNLVAKAAELALESGGNVKFDLKCYDETLSYALSGTSNKKVYENFKLVAEKFYNQRPELPVLTATTLLVSNYVDEEEVEHIAKFIAELNPEIPYSLLVFHPDFMMWDLTITPKEQVFRCYKVAKKYLKNVHIGNIHLLGLAL